MHFIGDETLMLHRPLAGTIHYALIVITNIGSTQASAAEGRHNFLVSAVVARFVCILLRNYRSAKILALTRKQEW